ncbi:MAG: family 43 glycosylhydrolase [Runella sp.]
MKKIIILTCCLIGSFLTAQAQITLTIDNQAPRLDTRGKPVDAHDGRVIRFGTKFYWYGTRYGNTNGFTTANEYVCYSSDDLQRWKLEGSLLPQKPEGVYYRPHVVFNALTKKYVLWYNWYPKLWNGQFGVAESDSPTGPFQILNDNVPVKHSSLGVGDLGVFVDDDQQAYLSYNTIQGHRVSVERLDPAYTASTLQGSEFIDQHCEAGSMFKHRNTYYLLTDYTCCFCTQGSGAKVFTASTPLGPYTYRQNINRHPGDFAPVLTDGITHDNFFEALDPKQQHGLHIEWQQPSEVSEIRIYQFTGNRAGQCGEVSNPRTHQPIVQHQFEISCWENGAWKPLKTKTKVEQMAQQKKYRLTFDKVHTQRLQVKPLYADSLQVLFLEEVEVTNAKGKLRVFKTDKRGVGKPIIPAQQTFVMSLQTPSGVQYLWQGDLWGSASDNIKGHDYQFWSKPLQFEPNGLIKPIEWVNEFKISISR